MGRPQRVVATERRASRRHFWPASRPWHRRIYYTQQHWSGVRAANAVPNRLAHVRQQQRARAVHVSKGNSNRALRRMARVSRRDVQPWKTGLPGPWLSVPALPG
jgi:hypothetical protein